MPLQELNNANSKDLHQVVPGHAPMSGYGERGKTGQEIEERAVSEPVRILLVGDTPTNLDLLEMPLEPLEQLPIRTQSGEEALRLLFKEKFALILLDMQMPGLDGIETANLIRSRPETREVPIIFATASEMDIEKILTACALGTADYVLKPIIPEQFRAKVMVFIELFRVKQRVERLLEKTKGYTQSLLLANHALLAAIPDTIFRVNREGVYLDYIPGASGSQTPTEGDFLGRTVDEILPLNAAETLMKLIHRCLNEGHVERMEWETEVQEEQHVLEARICRCEASDVLVFVRDITQQRMMEKKTGTAERLEAVGRVAGSVAHDFHNVLMVIQTHAGFLRDQAGSNEEADENYDVIMQGVEEATGLTDQLLTFSSGHQRGLEFVNVNDAIRGLDQILRRLGGGSVVVSIEMGANVSPIRADITQIKQVLMNLAMNACDAMPNGGSLTISTSTIRLNERTARDKGILLPAGDYVLLAVRDTGIGMDKKTLEHIFEPFFTTKKENRIGGGFGLATVYGIIKNFEGFIMVESKPGSGTLFSIYLPAQTAQ